ncbi:DUF2254 domain-containing protein [Sulfitobacter aestuariivivens]|uniref:DUF2254 domain-containing protein n=1 Tax=Sulfitobacter aestuariivivens TaxID=2766981 RepID=A0A927D111_9RHOB|nr:DUF2254 domain-containing protein [Sulfitobacter aestuariivivens]MBD3663093.1 DUF2254 domain-containing protein [Sulfitobacter aestuariivivens]
MTLNDFMPQTLLRKVRLFTRKLWVRVILMGLLAFVALGLTQLAEIFVPEKLARSLSGASADRLLDIIANAMLAVTIFSLTMMVSVYRSSSAQFTPRFHRLIIQDRTTQNTLATFIGAYVYALLGIILRETGVYVDDRAFVLFATTVLVLAIIVIYLVRWVLHLQTFGSLIETTRQIEEVTRQNFVERLQTPCLGAVPLTDGIPQECTTVLAPESGYVQHIYPEALQAAAEAHGMEVYLVSNIGSFVHLNEPLAQVRERGPRTEKEQDYETFEKAVLANVVLGDVRTYDQDPRFGLIVLGEIGSKALSPGVNDPGTAIDVITRVGRILSCYKDETRAETAGDVLDRLFVPPLDPGDLLEDGFGALTRDGQTLVEVQERLQSTLASLMKHPDRKLAKVARVAAKVALQRALSAMDFERDRDRLENSVEAALLQETVKDRNVEPGARAEAT